MNKANENAFKMARAHLALGNSGAYARIISGAHRACRTSHEQAKIEKEITDDGMMKLFNFTAQNILLARE